MAYMKDASGRRLDSFEVPSKSSQTVVVFGDSLTEQGGTITANPDIRVFSPWTWANMLLGQAFSVLGNLGVGGQTTAQIKARIGDVLTLNPAWVFLLCGTNNMGVVNGVADAEADITSMIGTFRRAGIRVVIGTIPPRTGGSYSGTQKADTHTLNAWIRQLARVTPDVIVVDYFSALADNSGNYRATAAGANPTSDGVHLSATGGFVSGSALADALRPLVPASPPLYGDPTPGPNLLVTPRPGSYGTGAPPYTLGGASSGSVTWSEPTRTNGGHPWKQVVIPAAGSLTMNANINIGASLAVGDSVAGAFQFEADNVAAEVNGIAGHLKSWNGSAWTLLRTAFNDFNQPQLARSGVIRIPPVAVPSGAVTVALYIEARGGMNLRFDRLGIYKTTVFPI